MKESEMCRMLIEIIIDERPDNYFELLDWLFKKYNTEKIIESAGKKIK